MPLKVRRALPPAAVTLPSLQAEIAGRMVGWVVHQHEVRRQCAPRASRSAAALSRLKSKSL